MIVVIIVAAIFFILGIIVLIGKGDNLIAGYNTASEEESMATPFSFLILTLALCFVVVILANTWAKKK